MEIVDTTEAVRFIWLAWKICGIYPVEHYKIYHIIHLLAILLLNIFWIVSFGIQMFFVPNLQDLLDSLPMTTLLFLCLVKFLVVAVMRKDLIEINNLLTQLDRKPITESQAKSLISLVKFCKNLVIAAFISYDVVDMTAAANGALSHPRKLSYEAWVPFPWQSTTFNYCLAVFYQFFFQTLLAMESISCDFSGPIYLMVLTGHIDNIMSRIERFNYDEDKTEDENLSELIDTIKYHRIVSEIFELVQKSLSYIIFFQFFATVLVLVMHALSYTLFPLKFAEMLYLILYIIAEILQVLPFCYCSHRFMDTTDRFVTSIYSCDWYMQSPKFKKAIIIFMQIAQKKNVIIAGKIIPVTLNTFVSVLKFSYSLLALAIRFQH